jgi:hypothetical protein
VHLAQGEESIHDFHDIDQYIDFNPRQRQSTGVLLRNQSINGWGCVD